MVNPDSELVRKLTVAFIEANLRDAAASTWAEFAAGVVREHVGGLTAENERLRVAIQRALDDEESGNGWGPDNTVCAYLRDALAEIAPDHPAL